MSYGIMNYVIQLYAFNILFENMTFSYENICVYGTLRVRISES